MSHGAAKPSPVAPRRVVRRTRRGDERCEQIRATATELFLQHGYDGVSLDEIVRAVGGSKTNVYSYFRNKEGLFGAIVNGLSEEFLASFIAIDVSTLGLAEGLRRLALALLDVLLQERHLAFQRLIIAEAVRFPGLGRAWFESGPERARGIIAQFIEAQQRAGRLRRGDPHERATLFHDMVTFDLLHRAMLVGKPGDDEIRHRVDAAIDAFVRGFAR
jgi:TetR/AcrR family transcriptional regulator, mexJK operon transcriptional repressor